MSRTMTASPKPSFRPPWRVGDVVVGRGNAGWSMSEIKVNGQKLETVTSFKYLGSVITDEGSKPEILSRIAALM